jgi:hypothetical protein
MKIDTPPENPTSSSPMCHSSLPRNKPHAFLPLFEGCWTVERQRNHHPQSTNAQHRMRREGRDNQEQTLHTSYAQTTSPTTTLATWQDATFWTRSPKKTRQKGWQSCRHDRPDLTQAIVSTPSPRYCRQRRNPFPLLPSSRVLTRRRTKIPTKGEHANRRTGRTSHHSASKESRRYRQTVDHTTPPHSRSPNSQDDASKEDTMLNINLAQTKPVGRKCTTQNHCLQILHQRPMR